VRRSRFCASLLERRQCELAELDRSFSQDHERTRLGLVRIAGDRRQSLDLFAVDESFPVQHYSDVAPDQPDVVGLPLARTIGNSKRDDRRIKGQSLAAVDGSGLIGSNPRPLRQRPLASPPNRTLLIMAQRRRRSSQEARLVVETPAGTQPHAWHPKPRALTEVSESTPTCSRSARSLTFFSGQPPSRSDSAKPGGSATVRDQEGTIRLLPLHRAPRSVRQHVRSRRGADSSVWRAPETGPDPYRTRRQARDRASREPD
jgi:hypothetical protein